MSGPDPVGPFGSVWYTDEEIIAAVERAVREQVAADIEAMPINWDGPDPKHRAPLDAETVRRNAARIARGGR